MRLNFKIENKQSTIDWLNRIKNQTDDARPLWYALTPKIVEFVNWQFNETTDSGKGWKSLTTKYREWKVKHGFSAFIGILTGHLREASGSKSKKTYRKDQLIWKVDNNLAENKSGQSYAPYFNKKRNIYRNTEMRVRNWLRTDLGEFKNHFGFTYSWLRNVLKVERSK